MQVAPAAIVIGTGPQFPPERANGADGESSTVTCRLAVPVFVSVTVCAAVVVPTVTDPNATGLPVIDKVPCTPVPPSSTVPLPGASADTVNELLDAPVAVGEYV